MHIYQKATSLQSLQLCYHTAAIVCHNFLILINVDVKLSTMRTRWAKIITDKLCDNFCRSCSHHCCCCCYLYYYCWYFYLLLIHLVFVSRIPAVLALPHAPGFCIILFPPLPIHPSCFLPLYSSPSLSYSPILRPTLYSTLKTVPPPMALNRTLRPDSLLRLWHDINHLLTY